MNHEIKMKNKRSQNRLLKDFLKLMLPSFIVFTVFMVMIFGFFVPFLEKKHLENKEALSRHLVELVIDYLSSFQRDLPPDFITEDIAKKRALNRIRDFRFGNEAKDYFWILDSNGVVLMHPFRPDIVNVDPEKMTAPDGRALTKLMKEMSSVANSIPQGGAIQYVWQRRDEIDKLGNKIAWLQKFEPWDWTIGTGVYLDEAESEIHTLKRNSVAAGILLGLFSAAVSFFLSFRAESHRKKEEHARDQLIESEKNLRIREELFRSIFEKSPHGIVITDLKSRRILRVNSSFEIMTGYNCDELLEEGMYNSLYPDTGDDYKDLVAEISREGLTENVNSVIYTKDKKRRDIIYSAILINYMGDRAILEMIVDVTEEKLLEEQLRQSQKMDVLGRLAGGIAHDFNNMLSVMIGSSELLMLKYGSEPDQKKYILRILETGEKAAALIRKLMLFSRKAGVVFRDFDLHNIIRNVADILEHTIDKRVQVVLSLNSERSRINGDPNLLGNALLNLALNSRDAMPDGGVITIKTSVTYLDEYFIKGQSFFIQPGHYIEVSVSDTGEGIPKEIMGKIFEPFFTTKPSGKGTGLGLSAVYGTIHEHGGAIDIYSEINIGSVFKLYLPCRSEEDFIKPENQGPVLYGDAVVLIIDDDDRIRANLNDMLTVLGYTVLSASGGHEGIEIYNQKKDEIDLVILDMIMPEINGTETIKRLNEISGDVKIIISSGFHDEDITGMISITTVKGYIQKPFRMNELSTLIHSILQEK